MTGRQRQWVLCLVLFITVHMGHSQSSHITSTDSQWAVHTAVSIVREGNLDLDEFSQRRRDGRFPMYGSFRHEGRLYPYYPIGPAIVAVPVIALFLLAPRQYVPEFGAYAFSSPLRMEMYVAAIIVALVSVLLFKIIFLATGSKRTSFLIALVFAFCTSAWSTASRALWQHGPSMLMLSAAVLILLKGRERERLVPFAAVPLAFSFWIRPTNLIPLGVITVFVFISYRRHFLRYLALVALVLGGFFVLNLAVFGTLLTPYYAKGFGSGISPGYAQALFANWISPNRGLLVFSPVLLFSFWGMALIFVKRSWRADCAGVFGSSPDRLEFFLVAIIFFHWLGISLFAPANWWAGHSFGPRLFSDVLPLFAFFLAFACERMRELPSGGRKSALIAAFFVLAAFSFFVHARGAYGGETWMWNVHPEDVDRMPRRVWDWSDLQFLR